MNKTFDYAYIQDSARWASSPSKDISLNGQFVSLVALKRVHADRLWPIVSAPEVVNAAFWLYLYSGPWQRYDDFRSVVESRVTAEDEFFYVLLAQPCRQAVGWICLRHADLRGRVVDIGIFLPSQSTQRRPLTTEAVYLLLKHVFDGLGFRTVRWITDSRNESSRRAAMRLGFSKDEREMTDNGDVYSPKFVLYVLKSHNWNIAKKALESWLEPKNFEQNGRQRHRLEDIRQALTIVNKDAMDVSASDS